MRDRLHNSLALVSCKSPELVSIAERELVVICDTTVLT